MLSLTVLNLTFTICFLNRYNYLNDLPSLDPELYRHLIFLKVISSVLAYIKIG